MDGVHRSIVSQGEIHTCSGNEEEQRETPLVEPEDDAAEHDGLLLVLYLPRKDNKRHGAVEEDEQPERQHPVSYAGLRH